MRAGPYSNIVVYTSVLRTCVRFLFTLILKAERGPAPARPGTTTVSLTGEHLHRQFFSLFVPVLGLGAFSTMSILHGILLVIFTILNLGGVESRRKYYNKDGTNKPYTHTRGADPLPWWAITLIFVIGVLGLFCIFLCLKRIYEKKRQRKIRSMFSRRSTRSQQAAGVPPATSTANLVMEPPGGMIAPPTYDQSVSDLPPPPGYSKENNPEADVAAGETPVSPSADTSMAPPSYEMSQTDGGEVVEVGSGDATVTNDTVIETSPNDTN